MDKQRLTEMLAADPELLRWLVAQRLSTRMPEVVYVALLEDMAVLPPVSEINRMPTVLAVDRSRSSNSWLKD